MRITKVYTRTGDQGTTRLVGGAEVRKDHPRIEAYGTLDELNSVLGIVRAFLGADLAALDGMLGIVQDDLFNVGTELATPPPDRWDGMYRIGEAEVDRLEGNIDALNEELPPLTEFVLPGGSCSGAFLHQARTVCRRAERLTLALQPEQPDVTDGPLRYLNRLSDLLFVAARWATVRSGGAEVMWRNPSTRSA